MEDSCYSLLSSNILTYIIAQKKIEKDVIRKGFLCYNLRPYRVHNAHCSYDKNIVSDRNDVGRVKT